MESALLFYFLLWILVGGLVGHAIGRIKGRPEAGVIWGVLLGALGWVVIAAGPNFRQKCPECKGFVEPGASRCKNCGALVDHASNSSGRNPEMASTSETNTGPVIALCSGCKVELTERNAAYFKSKAWCSDCFARQIR